MKHSETLQHIAPALVKATGHLKAIGKDSVNPHFKSKFASLEAIMAEVRPVLRENGLTIMQGATSPHTDEQGRITAFTIETMLLHLSGEWISNSVFMPLAKLDPQGSGAAVSYGRRYGVSSLLAIVTDEDLDGNDAMPTPQQRAQETVRQSQQRTQAAAAAPAPARRERGGPPAQVAEAVQQVMQRAAKPAPAQPAEVPSCPNCAGPMWDNRARKTNPKAPDFKCRDKQCEGLYWPGQWPPQEQEPAYQGASAQDDHDFNVDDYAPQDDLPF